MLPVAVINPPVPIFPIFAFPDTDTEVNVPVLVMFGCDDTVILPAKFAKFDVIALVTLPVTFEP